MNKQSEDFVWRLIFRKTRKNPKTGKLEPPPPGKKAWPIWIKEPIDKGKPGKKSNDLPDDNC